MSLNHSQTAFYMAAPGCRTVADPVGTAHTAQTGLTDWFWYPSVQARPDSSHKHKSIVNHSTDASMLPAARCTLHVAATASAERNLRCTFQFPATRNGNGKGDTRHRTLGTVSQWTCVADCGMQLSKRKSSPHPREHDALGALGASCNQCQNDCGLTGENLWFDPCIFCHLSSRVWSLVESSWSRVGQPSVTPPCTSFWPEHAHPRLSVRHHRHQSVPVFRACSRLQFSETRTAAAGQGADREASMVGI